MDAMNAPFASITKTWHNTSYPAISPTRPELSAKGKSVFITGGGTGIGAAVVYSFARAGAREFALAGRTQATLSETALRLKTDFPDVKVLTLITDVTKQDTVDAAFETTMKAFGKIDICISNAGYSAPPAPIASISEKEWQTAFDINVNGSLYIIKAFLRYAKEGACLFNTSSGIGHMPTIPNISSYVASKAAGIRIFESVATENPGFFVVNVQPGVVVTAASKMGNGGAALDVDDADLAGNFYVWLASPEASFLRGKFVWVNWDVDELKALKDKILDEDLLNIDMKGLDWRGWEPMRMVKAARNM